MRANKIRKDGFTFSDLSIIPRIPKIHYQDAGVQSQLTPKILLKKPFISSPMDTVTNANTAISLAKNGAVGILHYNFPSFQALYQEIIKVKEYDEFDETTATCLGKKLVVGLLVKLDFAIINDLEKLIDAGADFVALDSLHSNPHLHIPFIKRLKTFFPDLEIMSGNIVHPDDCLRLIDSGVQCLRVGFNAASINDGKSLFGCGRSQANAVFECAKIGRKYNIPIIADGGLKTSGDIAIAFALGANFVMLGRMFAASYDTPGNIIVDGNHKKKLYTGMSRADTIDSETVAEGRELYLNADESIVDILNRLDRNLKISIARSGCISIEDFYRNSEIQMLTQSAIEETKVKG